MTFIMNHIIAIVHNTYGKISGEETAVDNLASLLEKRGLIVRRFNRSSSEIENKLSGKATAFFSGIHNPFAQKAFAKFLKSNRPAVVHIHNLYPLISPSILPVCKAFGVPVIMTVHNFRLVCPDGLLLSRGEICHRCLGGREYWCVLRNCENDIFKSTGYAFRTMAARLFRRYYDHVDHFICLSEFQKNILVDEGLPADRVSVLANPVSFDINIPLTPVYQRGDLTGDMNISPVPIYQRGEECFGYVAYVGRISPEKDILTLMETARRLGEIPFKFAGDYHRMSGILKNKPANCEFLGQLNAEEIINFYLNARMVVFATRCYEGFPTVLLEAMFHGLPIICSRIGGLPEIVEEGINGLLYEPGNEAELTANIQTLLQNPELCKKLGEAGRQKVREKYDADRLLDQLLEIYRKVIAKRMVDRQ